MSPCPKHSNYKGINATKRDCPHCKALYKYVSEKTNKFVSITTPDFKCGMSHLLTEVICIMLYGKQPEYFWRKSSPAKQEVKNEYPKIYKEISGWNKINPTYFKGTFAILLTSFLKRYKNKVVNDLDKNNEEISEYKKEEKSEIGDLSSLKSDMVKHKLSKWKFLKGKDGKEK